MVTVDDIQQTTSTTTTFRRETNMKAKDFTHKHLPALCFIAETQDDVFLLGQMSRCLPYSDRGYTLDGQYSLTVFVKDVVKKIVDLPEPCEH